LQTHRVNILYRDSLTLLIDLSDLVDLALLRTPNHANPISCGEKYVLAALAFGDSRRVKQSSVDGTKGGGLWSGIPLGSKVSLLPVLPASSACSIDSINDCPVVVPSHPNVVFAVRQFVPSLGPEDLLLGLLSGRSRPLNDLLHCSGGGSAMAELMLFVNSRDAPAENCGRISVHVTWSILLM